MFFGGLVCCCLFLFFVVCFVFCFSFCLWFLGGVYVVVFCVVFWGVTLFVFVFCCCCLSFCCVFVLFCFLFCCFSISRNVCIKVHLGIFIINRDSNQYFLNTDYHSDSLKIGIKDFSYLLKIDDDIYI